MRKILIFTYLLTSFSISSIGQNLPNTTKIKDFIKVWGFLKYYDPSVATGNIDWDSVFIQHIPNIIGAKNSNQYRSEILAVINSAGKSAKSGSNNLRDSLFIFNKVTNSWINNSKTFDDRIKNQLQQIYDNRNQDSNRYIKMNYMTPDFNGEKRYDSMTFPELKYRLLFLSRFWNIINYFAPYKYMIGENWDDVLIKYIPRFMNTTDTVSYYKAWMELAKALHDGHSQLTLNNQDTQLNELVFGKYTVPFHCQILDGQVVVRKISDDSLCKIAGIRRGDVILKLGNESVEKEMEVKRKYISASNELSSDHQLSRFVLDGETPMAHLTVKRRNKVFTTTIERISSSKDFQKNWRQIFNYTSGNSVFQKLDDSILLIYAAQIWSGNIDTVRSQIKQSKAIIFDVRNYPNGENYAIYNLFDIFLNKAKIINYSTVALPDFPSLFKWTPSSKIGGINMKSYRGKVVILCDERTQSQGEYTCMALQTIPRSITIGTQTAGADGNQTPVPIGGGLQIFYSGCGIYYPNKTQTQRTGIKIDIHVRKTIAAIKNNQDEILERAIRYIKTGK
jgi:C-terminal processing protease CtpA/Prc